MNRLPAVSVIVRLRIEPNGEARRAVACNGDSRNDKQEGHKGSPHKIAGLDASQIQHGKQGHTDDDDRAEVLLGKNQAEGDNDRQQQAYGTNGRTYIALGTAPHVMRARHDDGDLCELRGLQREVADRQPTRGAVCVLARHKHQDEKHDGEGRESHKPLELHEPVCARMPQDTECDCSQCHVDGLHLKGVVAVAARHHQLDGGSREHHRETEDTQKHRGDLEQKEGRRQVANGPKRTGVNPVRHLGACLTHARPRTQPHWRQEQPPSPGTPHRAAHSP